MTGQTGQIQYSPHFFSGAIIFQKNLIDETSGPLLFSELEHDHRFSVLAITGKYDQYPS